MEVISKTLAYAMAFLGSVNRESDSDADDDANALEEITSLLAELTAIERTALQTAAQLAIQAERQAKNPNHNLIEGYKSVIENLAESEG